MISVLVGTATDGGRTLERSHAASSAQKEVEAGTPPMRLLQARVSLNEAFSGLSSRGEAAASPLLPEITEA